MNDFGYLKGKTFHVTNKNLFHKEIKNIDEFKETNNIDDIIFDMNISYSYHMGNGGHGRM
jgi:hypothetical protein